MITTFKDLADVLVCPLCHSKLSWQDHSLFCNNCSDSFAVSDGIPEMCRGINHLPALFADDHQRADALRSYAKDMSVPDLIRQCYQLAACRTPSSLEITTKYMLDGEARMRATIGEFRQVAAQRKWPLPCAGTALDLGCGVGTTTGHLTRDFDMVFGVNPACDEMVVAEKVNREWFHNRITLLRAFGEHLPFQDRFFDLVCAVDVIEHVANPLAVLKEVERILKPGGMLLLTSPNQFNAVSPDGHVQVRFVGFFPDQWREPYVRWRSGGCSWRKRNVQPLSYWRLTKHLKQLSTCAWHVNKPVMLGPKSGPRTRFICALPGLRHLVNWLLHALGKEHLALVRKLDN